VVRTEPPVGESDHAGDADAGECSDRDAVANPDGGGRATAPEAAVAQWTSARLRAAATNA
jgi:hypothetical protein